MQTLDVFDKQISSSFIEATESISQLVKPLVIMDMRDAKHLSNVIVSTNDSHPDVGINDIGYYFDKYRAIDGIEYEGFAWGVADAKDNYNQIITACGKYRAMPSDLTDNLKYGWWSGSKSNSSGGYETQPYLDINFDPTIVNKIKIVTSRNHGQVKSLNLAVVRSNSNTVLNELITFNTDDNEFEKTINLNETYQDIERILISIVSTKNPEDRARIVSVSPLYRVDVSDYVKEVSDTRVRDLHETSLPIAGTSQSSCEIYLDNTGKDFSLLTSSSLYGKYLDKDVRVFLSYGWLTYGSNSSLFTTSLTSNLNSSNLDPIPVTSEHRLPEGDIDDLFDESK
jgi:hypothetical protein